MKFAIISDIHIGEEKEHKGIIRKMSRYSLEFISAFINKMNSEIKPFFVINLGDTINDINYNVDVKNLKIVISNFKQLNCPMYHLVGNHEQKTIKIKELEKLLNHKPLFYSFDQADYHFIVLFSERKNLSIEDNQKNWLKTDLEKTTRKSIIFVHHALADQDLTGNFWFEENPERALIINRKEIRKILEDSKKVIAVFNGHLHWNRMDVHNNIPYFNIQSLVENFQNKDIPSNSYAVVKLTNELIDVDIKGTDSQHYLHKIINT
ncbi:MAG: metallophosphoesterase [Candidatus Paceibacterota bacterium]